MTTRPRVSFPTNLVERVGHERHWDKKPVTLVSLFRWGSRNPMEAGSGYEEPVQSLVSGFDRDRVAEERDRVSDAHDVLADDRDLCAEHRDHRAERREQFATDVDPQNAFDRSEAKRDREQSAVERLNSRDDRASSNADRILAARERSEYLVDELTGAHRRADGLFELEREVVRAKRTGEPFTLAFVDIDGLEAVNDSRATLAAMTYWFLWPTPSEFTSVQTISSFATRAMSFCAVFWDWELSKPRDDSTLSVWILR